MAVSAVMHVSRINFADTAKLAPYTLLTGSINPTASTSVTGVGTRFLSELAVGDAIVVSGEQRTVATIATDTSLTVTSAFTNTPNDPQPLKVEPTVFPEHWSDIIASRLVHWRTRKLRLDLHLSGTPNVGAFFLVNHQLTSARSVELFSSADGTTYNSITSWSPAAQGANKGYGQGGYGVGTMGKYPSARERKEPPMKNLFYFFDPAAFETVRRWRLEILDPGRAVPDISFGRCFLSEPLVPISNITDLKFGIGSGSSSIFSAGGVQWPTREQVYRRASFKFEDLSDAELFADWLYHFTRTDTTDPFLVAFAPTDANTTLQEWVTFYASFPAHTDFSPAPTLGNWESQTVQLREVF